MEPIKLGGGLNYGIPKDTKAEINTVTKEIPNDSYNPKYKPKRNKKAAGTITTVALMAASAFAAYKGKKHIHNAATAVSKKVGKYTDNIWSGFKAKCPNLGNAISSLGKACKTPINAITKLFKK